VPSFELVEEVSKTGIEKTYTTSLQLINIPSDLGVIELSPSEVEVSLKIPKQLENSISPADISLRLNLENANVSDKEFTISESMIGLLPDVEVMKISPSKINIKLEKLEEIMLEVEPSIIGNLRKDLILEKFEVIPSKIKVKGPLNIINENDKVRILPIDISSEVPYKENKCRSAAVNHEQGTCVT